MKSQASHTGWRRVLASCIGGLIALALPLSASADLPRRLTKPAAFKAEEAAQTYMVRYRKGTPGIIARSILDILYGTSASTTMLVDDDKFTVDQVGTYEIVYENAADKQQTKRVIYVTVWDEIIRADDVILSDGELDTWTDEATWIERAGAAALYYDGASQDGTSSSITSVDLSAVKSTPGEYPITFRTQLGTEITRVVTVYPDGALASIPDDAVPLSGPDQEGDVLDLGGLSPSDIPNAGFASEDISYHVVRFQHADGTVLNAFEVPEGTMVFPPADPAMNGATFRHWYDVRLGELTPFDFMSSIQEDIVLRACFAYDEAAPTDIFSITSPDDTTIGSEISPPQDALTDEELQMIAGLQIIDVVEKETPADYTLFVISALEEEQATAETSEEPIEPDSDPVVEPEPAPTAPYAEITSSFEGEAVVGTAVTVTATLHNIPEGADVRVQWQNNASGEYADVEGATELSYTFTLTEENIGTQWRIQYLLRSDG